MPLGDPVAGGDYSELGRGSAALEDTLLDVIGDTVEVGEEF